jgi:hypothetical protein
LRHNGLVSRSAEEGATDAVFASRRNGYHAAISRGPCSLNDDRIARQLYVSAASRNKIIVFFFST